jgi:hypothetical protein
MIETQESGWVDVAAIIVTHKDTTTELWSEELKIPEEAVD